MPSKKTLDDEDEEEFGKVLEGGREDEELEMELELGGGDDEGGGIMLPPPPC